MAPNFLFGIRAPVDNVYGLLPAYKSSVFDLRDWFVSAAFIGLTVCKAIGLVRFRQVESDLLSRWPLRLFLALDSLNLPAGLRHWLLPCVLGRPTAMQLSLHRPGNDLRVGIGHSLGFRLDSVGGRLGVMSVVCELM